MKKQYIKPTAEIMDIDTEQMMAASTGQGVTTSGDTGEGFLNNSHATQGGSALSKDHGFGLWDDEDY